MEAIIDAVMSRSRTVLAILFVTIIFGVSAYITIPKESRPDIAIPYVTVRIPHPGISPEDAERLLLKPMETQLQSIKGMKNMVGTASEGMAVVTLEFDPNFDQQQALDDVREKVDLVKSKLPADTKEPVVQEINTSLFPTIVVGLGGNIPERELYRIGRDLQDQLETIPTVLEAKIVGDRDEVLDVIVDPVKLENYHITQQELLNAVSQNNRLVSSGAIDTGGGRFPVKVPGTFNSATDVQNLVLKASGEGTVTLADVAELRRTFKDPDTITLLNGKPGITIEVVKRTGANIIATNDAVRKVVDQERAHLSKGVELTLMLDESEWIRTGIDNLQASILTAVSLVMIIVVAALGFRSGLMVGISLPTTFLISFAVIKATGGMINSMTMFGLVISVGILVDGAIVVVEYADRKMAEGFDRKRAYGLAAKRMFWPIFSSTLTTIGAFLPLLFWPGLTGKFMFYMPLTVIVMLTSSLVTAIFFLPVLGGTFGKSENVDPDRMKALAGDSDLEALEEIGGVTQKYVNLVTWALRRPLAILGGVLSLVAAIVIVFSVSNVKTEFFPSSEPQSIAVFVGAIGNMSLNQSRALVSDVDREIRKVKGIRSVDTTITSGGQQAGGFGNPPPADMIGRLNIELVDYKKRKRSGWDIIKEIRSKAHDFPGLRLEVRQQQNGPVSGKDIQLEITSRDGDLAYKTTGMIRDHMDRMNGLIEVEDTRSLPGIEWNLQVDRRAAGRFRADVNQIGAVVQLVTNGLKIGEYRPNDAKDEVDIRVRYPHEYRSLNQLDNLRISTLQGQIPISNIVKRVPKQKITSINRMNGKRVYRIRANVGTEVTKAGKVVQANVDEKVNELRQWIEKDAHVDPNVSYKFVGADEEAQSAASFMEIALFMSLFLIGIILLTQFNNFYYVLLILSSVVISTVGALVGVLVTGMTFSLVMAGVGIIALAGIVVNNNIVLIDTYQRLVATCDCREAILHTTAQRLRPVMLTTITTICGLVPMALQFNINFFDRSISFGGPAAESWVPLSVTVIFGLGFATLITLMLTPCMLYLPTHLRQYRAAKRGRRSATEEVGATAAMPRADHPAAAE